MEREKEKGMDLLSGGSIRIWTSQTIVSLNTTEGIDGITNYYSMYSC